VIYELLFLCVVLALACIVRLLLIGRKILALQLRLNWILLDLIFKFDVDRRFDTSNCSKNTSRFAGIYIHPQTFHV